MAPPLGVEIEQPEVRLRLRSEMTQLDTLHEQLSAFLSRAGLSALERQKLTLSVRELVANAIEWGHRYQADRPVSVVCRLESDRVLVVVRDTGAGFDRDNLPHAADPDDPCRHLSIRAERNLREGGFGILLASGLVDELTYNKVGNEARVVLYRDR